MENKKVMGSNILYYMNKIGIDRHELCKKLNIPYSSLNSWINAQSYPRIDKIEKLAVFFGIAKADLVEKRRDNQDDEINSKYINDENKSKITYIEFTNPDLQKLIEAAQHTSLENIKLVTEILKKLK